MYFERGQIDRGIYNAIRKELVRIGRLPDAEGMTKDGYFQARADLNLITKVVECFPVDNYDFRNTWKQNCIVVDCEDENVGDFGGAFVTFEENVLTGGPLPDGTGLTLDKKISPSNAQDVNYTVRFLTQDREMESVMSGAIRAVLDRARPIKGLNLDMSETVYPFRIQEVGKIDVSGPGFIEKGFRYVVKNVYLTPSRLLTQVPKMTEFKLVTEPTKQ